ncbi:rna-directed dna polymerase from mobile element jockey-like [Limosa lapponica baueri]|uniref:Rna-directed dna polymerase from mobile element jockey-like n=1 Tax=Limosa lapponica baueri TaxID=1758121 RepID=A0A2I0TLR6_LIMLA|nr:rna-directed dna polymerase from mobile element jockey-like [Limosa lapponica baueri]
MVRDLLQHIDTHESTGPNGVHLRILRKLAEVLTKPLSIVYQQSWLIGQVPDGWTLVNVTPIHKKGWKEDPRNYRPVSLTLVPGKVMEQIILSAIIWHVQDNQVIRPSQHGSMKGQSCLTNLISFYDKATHFLDRERLWMLFTWTLLKPSTPCPTAFSWRNWLPMAWMGVRFAG